MFKLSNYSRCHQTLALRHPFLRLSRGVWVCGLGPLEPKCIFTFAILQYLPIHSGRLNYEEIFNFADFSTDCQTNLIGVFLYLLSMRVQNNIRIPKKNSSSYRTKTNNVYFPEIEHGIPDTLFLLN